MWRIAHFLRAEQWNWIAGGIMLGICLLLAVYLVQPITLSTQYVVVDGIIWDLVDKTFITYSDVNQSGYQSTNDYVNRGGGGLAKSIRHPWNYGVVFALFVIVGGFIAHFTTRFEQVDWTPKTYRQYIDTVSIKKYILTFIGGILALFGARLADGSITAHTMSGLMQTSLSGYIFTILAFLIAIPVAILVHTRSR